MSTSLFSVLAVVFAVGLGTTVAKAGPKPATGEITLDVGGYRLNSLLVAKGKQADLPPIVFIHGASTSLYDPLYAFGEKLKGRATLLFVDRPGHGLSDIGPKETISPDVQADAIATLMRARGVETAIIVGHSFGGAIAAAFAVRHPTMVKGLVFLSPALYPWPGGVSWYYDAASAPFTGALFSTLIAPPAGLLALNSAVRGVFAPNPMPADYVSRTKAYRALQPLAFRHNAKEVRGLNAWAKTASQSYRRIKAPTVIIAGDADAVVSTDIHARHLARDIAGARLLVVHNLGHKSDYVARDLAIGAIETIAGKRRNLTAMTEALETKIVTDGTSGRITSR